MKHHTDFLVIGSGIAALSFSLRIAKYFKDATVTIITKESKSESNTKYAQGGIAVVNNWEKDSIEQQIWFIRTIFDIIFRFRKYKWRICGNQEGKARRGEEGLPLLV